MSIEMPMQVIWGLIGYILISSFGFVWWAATTTQQLKTLREMVNALTVANNLFARREDIARELGVIERQVDTICTKYDKLKEKVDGHVGQNKGVQDG